MRPTTPNFNFSRHGGISPPETPTTKSSFTFGESSRSAGRYGFQNFSRPLTRPIEKVHTADQGPNLSFQEPIRLEDLSPRSSTPSSETSYSPPRSLSPESFTSERHEHALRTRVVTRGNFIIQELAGSEAQTDSEDATSIVRPDGYEDADSEHANSTTALSGNEETQDLADEFENLDCNNLSDERELWLKKKRAEKRRNRHSAGSLHKRTLSQSIGSDTDDEDMRSFDANEAGSSARRLRRKVGGERTSLIFDDPPQRILECEEPESGDEVRKMQVVEPDACIDVEEELMHALPYYEREDSMMEMGYL